MEGKIRKVLRRTRQGVLSIRRKLDSRKTTCSYIVEIRPESGQIRRAGFATPADAANYLKEKATELPMYDVESELPDGYDFVTDFIDLWKAV